MSGLLEPLDDRPAAPAARRKSSILDLLTRRNSSSPELDKVPNRNFSTRSLSRLGSFGASTTALPSLSPSSKSSPTVSPVESNFSVSDLSLPKEQAAPRDYFTPLPHEVQLQIVSYLPLKTIRRLSSISRQWRLLCSDGALFTTIDTRTFYRIIPAPVLLKMLISAGPFLHHLNLRGCAQLCSSDIMCLALGSTELISLSLEGCSALDSTSLRSVLNRNPNLKSLDVSGLAGVTDEVAAEAALSCSNLEFLDLGWCPKLTAVGLLDIATFCTKLNHLRLCENTVFKGHRARDVMLALHHLENLEVLNLSGCRDITDATLAFYLHGVPASNETELRKLPVRHLNLSRLRNLTSLTLRNMAGVVPHLQRLELAGSTTTTAFDEFGFATLFPTIPNLTHLDLEDNHQLTDEMLLFFCSLPVAKSIVHIQLSYCLNISDRGIVHLLQRCPRLRNLEVDNTGAGDGMLMEAPRLVARRLEEAMRNNTPAEAVGLRIAAYDCSQITWVGISEVLSRNLSQCKAWWNPQRRNTTATFQDDVYNSPAPMIRLKCTFEWQKLVDAHTRRCLRGEFAAAEQIGLGFSKWMMEELEDGAWGGHARRRRRRALGLGEQGEDAFVMGVGRRRLRAFSAPSSCVVM